MQCCYPIPCTAMCFRNRCCGCCCSCSAPCCNCCCSYHRGTPPPSSFGTPTFKKPKRKKKKKKPFTPSKIEGLTPSKAALLSPSKQQLIQQMKEEKEEEAPTRKCDPRCLAKRSRPNTAPETNYCDAGGVHMNAAENICEPPTATSKRNCMSEYCPVNYNRNQQQYQAIQQQQYMQRCYNCLLMQNQFPTNNTIGLRVSMDNKPCGPPQEQPLTCGPPSMTNGGGTPQYPQQCGVYNMAYGRFPNPFYNSQYSLQRSATSQMGPIFSRISNFSNINNRPSYIIKKCSTCGRVHVARNV